MLPSIMIGGIGWVLNIESAKWLPLALFQGIWCFAETWFVERYRPGSPVETAGSNHSKLPITAGILAFSIVVISTTEAFLTERWLPALAAIGLLIGGLGVALRLTAIRKLGPRFLDQITLMPGHQIENTGIYKWIKHPAELGFCLAVLGYVLMCGSTAGFILLVVAQIPVSVLRIKLENQLLAGAR